MYCYDRDALLREVPYDVQCNSGILVHGSQAVQFAGEEVVGNRFVRRHESFQQGSRSRDAQDAEVAPFWVVFA